MSKSNIRSVPLNILKLSRFFFMLHYGQNWFFSDRFDIYKLVLIRIRTLEKYFTDNTYYLDYGVKSGVTLRFYIIFCLLFHVLILLIYGSASLILSFYCLKIFSSSKIFLVVVFFFFYWLAFIIFWLYTLILLYYFCFMIVLQYLFIEYRKRWFRKIFYTLCFFTCLYHLIIILDFLIMSI